VYHSAGTSISCSAKSKQAGLGLCKHAMRRVGLIRYDPVPQILTAAATRLIAGPRLDGKLPPTLKPTQPMRERRTSGKFTGNRKRGVQQEPRCSQGWRQALDRLYGGSDRRARSSVCGRAGNTSQVHAVVTLPAIRAAISSNSGRMPARP